MARLCEAVCLAAAVSMLVFAFTVGDSLAAALSSLSASLMAAATMSTRRGLMLLLGFAAALAAVVLGKI